MQSTIVFADMLGVTLFGIFLTPIFFYEIQWFGRPPRPSPSPQQAPPSRRLEQQTQTQLRLD